MVAANCRKLVWRDVWSEKGGEYDVEVHAPGGGVLASFRATLKPGGNEIVFDRTAPCRIDDVVLARKK